MTLIILAAGTSIPFGEFPKQLLDVGGETLLERQVRQFEPHCDRIYLMTHRSELNHLNPKVTKINPAWRRWKCDTLFSTQYLWPHSDLTVVIHGDVYFTDAAVEKILSCTGEPIAFFWNGGIEGTEAYAICFSAEHSGALNLAVSYVVKEGEKNKSPAHDCGFMRLMSACEGLTVKHDKVELTDGTRDFDHPHKHEEWRKAMGWPPAR